MPANLLSEVGSSLFMDSVDNINTLGEYWAKQLLSFFECMSQFIQTLGKIHDTNFK